MRAPLNSSSKVSNKMIPLPGEVIKRNNYGGGASIYSQSITADLRAREDILDVKHSIKEQRIKVIVLKYITILSYSIYRELDKNIFLIIIQNKLICFTANNEGRSKYFSKKPYSTNKETKSWRSESICCILIYIYMYYYIILITYETVLI